MALSCGDVALNQSIIKLDNAFVWNDVGAENLTSIDEVSVCEACSNATSLSVLFNKEYVQKMTSLYMAKSTTKT